MSSNKRSTDPVVAETKQGNGHQRMQSNPTYLNHMNGVGAPVQLSVKKKNLSS